MIKIQRKSQSGRSMVEMLGVLAIIGVLSVGGIAGYRYAMEMHTTNELMDRLQKLYIATEGSRQKLKKSSSLNLSFGRSASSYGFDNDLGFDFIRDVRYGYSIKNGVHSETISVQSKSYSPYNEKAEQIFKNIQEKWPFTDCWKRGTEPNHGILCGFHFDESDLF